MRIRSASILAVIGILAASDRTNAQTQTYHLTDLGVILGQTGQTISHAAGINNAGQVAGHSFWGPETHAVRFTNGVAEDLGTIPGGSRSYGIGINDLGQVVGDSEYSVNGGSIRHAALFSNGTVTDLGILPGWGNYSRAHGINQAGEVVGYSGHTNPTASPSPTQTRAFIWDATNGMRDLGTLGGGGYSKALSINNSGLVTGEARTATGGGTHAFIWNAAGGMRDIGTIAGDFSVGNSINANGHVVGKSSISADNRDHAFFYDGTTMHDLGSLGSNHFFSDRSVAYGINIHDHVVGGTYRPYEGGALYGIPFIYRDGQMLDLTTLVDASGDDYQLGYATAINDAGQIALNQSIKRSTNEIHAVLLTPNGNSTPTPTPASTPMPTPTPCGPPTTFANTAPISIPAAGSMGVGAPYPSNIGVAALAGNVTQVTIKLNNLNHVYPDDVDILLVGPGGQNAIILADVGGAPDAVNVTLTLDDAAPSSLPDATALMSGTFKPTNIVAGDLFPAPAPSPSGGSALSVFIGINPNGTWSLYVLDDESTDAGSLTGGWELNISTDTCGSSTPTPAPTATPAPTPTPSTTPAPTTPPAATPTPTTTPAPTSTPEATPTPAATPEPTTSPGATSTPAPTATPSATPPAQAINLSTRMRVQTGDNVGIGGFIITGSAPKHVLLRAIGPSLAEFGVPNVLTDPMLELHGPGTFVTVTNDNWKDDPAQQIQIQATGIAPTNDLESAIDATLPPGTYTAILRGNGSNRAGVALIEVYDLNQLASSKLDNISTRALISTGDNIVIAGFMLGQGGSDNVVVRGIGPSLTSAGVPNAVADPTLELRDGNGALLVANNDWQDDPLQASQLTSAGLAPSNNLESALVMNLPPGLYTALLAGRNGGTGIGLVEVYDRVGP